MRKRGKEEIGGLPTKTSATLPLCVFQSLLQGSAEARSVIWRKCEKSRFGENYQSNSKCLAKCIFSASNLWLAQSQQQSVGKLKSGANFVRTRKKEFCLHCLSLILTFNCLLLLTGSLQSAC